MGQHHRSTHDLVGMPWIHTQVHRHVYRLVEFCIGRVFNQRHCIGNRKLGHPNDLRGRGLELLAVHSHQSTTSSPIERAVPAIMRMALSRSVAFRSAILISAIFFTCARVTRPTLVRFGLPLPFSTPASFSRRFGAGGVLVMKLKVRSAKIVTTTGMTIPLWLWVRALNCFTNSMMLTPCGPSAVPTGGAGVAAPAGHCNFTIALIFFAISSPVASAHQGDSHNDPCG